MPTDPPPPHAPASHVDNLIDAVQDYVATESIRGRKVAYEWRTFNSRKGHYVQVDIGDMPEQGPPLMANVVDVFRPQLHDAFRAAVMSFAKWRAEAERDLALPALLEASVEDVRAQGVGNGNGGEA